MHDTLFTVAAGWMTFVLVAGVVLVLRSRTTMTRILALDTVSLILVAVLVLFSVSEGTTHYLDAAMMLALLSFVATLAAAKFARDGRPF